MWGIRFLSLIDHVDSAEPKARKMRQLNGLLNQWYCEDLSDNIRAVLHKKMENGQFIGSFACYGYTKDPGDHHHLIPDPPAAAVVRQIYQWYLEGNSISQIADRLTGEHILRPSCYKKQNGLLFQAPFTTPSQETPGWSVSTIKRILSDPVYTGTLVQGKEQKLSCQSRKRISLPREQWVITEHAHQPLISSQTFEQVQALLASNRKNKRGKNKSEKP
ncbi:MAG: recombinase family protein [Lachnospiraceae bacterium]|nr:recombinase family protein [Lachnospiraceae bacterium]